MSSENPAASLPWVSQAMTEHVDISVGKKQCPPGRNVSGEGACLFDVSVPCSPCFGCLCSFVPGTFGINLKSIRN